MTVWDALEDAIAFQGQDNVYVMVYGSILRLRRYEIFRVPPVDDMSPYRNRIRLQLITIDGRSAIFPFDGAGVDQYGEYSKSGIVFLAKYKTPA